MFSRRVSRAIKTVPSGVVNESGAPTAQNGLFIIAGTMFADSQGNDNGTGVFKTAGDTIHYKRPQPGSGINKQVQQFGDAAIAVGGTASYSLQTDGNGTVNDKVDISGVALNVPFETTPPILNGASGPQVRGFLAGFIQCEGSQTGLIGDDPSTAHLQIIKDQLIKPEAYVVPTTITGINFFQLNMNTSADYYKVQAYPFIVFGRCPGGARP